MTVLCPAQLPDLKGLCISLDLKVTVQRICILCISTETKAIERHHCYVARLPFGLPSAVQTGSKQNKTYTDHQQHIPNRQPNMTHKLCTVWQNSNLPPSLHKQNT